jgi:ATP-dependent DNA helicase 2 subunit 1
MAPYDSWNKLDDSEDEELADISYFEGKRDVILFCIDASESMQDLYPDPAYADDEEEPVMTCHLYTALEAAMMIQKKKVVVGPNDCVGILLFNTVSRFCHCYGVLLTFSLV